MIIHNVVVIALLFVYFILVRTAPDKTLRFNERGKFKIVQFTDLHYGYDEYENQQTAIVQDVILEAEKPDLVIITGDMVSGYEWKWTGGWYQSLWEKLIAPMEKHNIRWAIALGNHDVEGDLGGTEIVNLDSAHELSLTQLGPSQIGGATNYYLPVYEYDPLNKSTQIGQILWIFDSGSNDCLGVKGWGCVQNDQIEWYKNTSHSLRSGTPYPALAFFHIPLYEHLDLWNVKGVEGDLGDEGVCCSAVNTGLYATMQEVGDIRSVFCGHDHSNDYIGDYHGITLGYGRKTGYGGYGPPLGWKKGARVIEISEHAYGHTNTWLRLEDGSVEIQRQNSLSWRKYLGCCHMEGHRNFAITWIHILVLLLYAIVFIGVFTCLVRILVRFRRRRRSPQLGKDDDGGKYGSGSNWEITKLTDLWWSKAPRPRQRRINELESV